MDLMPALKCQPFALFVYLLKLFLVTNWCKFQVSKESFYIIHKLTLASIVSNEDLALS